MAYWHDIYTFLNSIEHEAKCAGKFGAKGEKREAKKKATPEQIKKQNQWKREVTVRRLIKANFLPDDLWVCLKYPQGTRITIERFLKDIKNFLEKMRRFYKKRKEPFKFIIRKEVGTQGGLHTHILVNRSDQKPDIDTVVQRCWINGKVNYSSIYELGGYEKLANYIVSEPDEEEMKQLSLFPEEEQKKLKSYSTSRNLIHPVPERKVYSKWTIRKMVENGPEPTPGFYIDKNSIVYGKNKFTGMTYFRYTECRIKEYNSWNRPEKIQRE